MATKMYAVDNAFIVDVATAQFSYPMGTVRFTLIGDTIDFATPFTKNYAYTDIQDQAGNPFASAQDLFDYLNAQTVTAVNATFTPSGTQDVNITAVASSGGFQLVASEYMQDLQLAELQNIPTNLAKKGTIDAGNSTDVALNNAATFTGTGIDVSEYASVIVACLTDQSGTLQVQFSTDNVNWDSTLSFTVAANTNEVHRITVTRQYMRVVFTNNSGVNQTFLRLQTLLGSQQTLTRPLNSAVQSDADTVLVSPVDFNLLLAEGLYQNRAVTIKDGLSTSTNAANTPKDISNEVTNGSPTYAGFPTGAPEEGQIVVAGADTGTVYYSYLASDTDTDYVFGSVAVAGAGNYNLGHNIWRCNFAYFVKNSSTSANVGTITIRNRVTTTNVFCVIDAGYGQTYCPAYTVPAGSSVFIDRFNGNLRGSATGAIDGAMWYRAFNESPRLRFPFELQYGSLYFDDVDYLIRIPEKVDFIPRILVCSTNGLVAKYSYRILKVKS